MRRRRPRQAYASRTTRQDMEYRVLGWPSAGPRLRLDHREFAYAGKFVISTTGKAVAYEGDPPSTGVEEYADVVGAASFDEDRTDSGTCCLRYVTVRADRRGEGVGPWLCAHVADAAERRGYDRVRIAVNNPFSYHALYKAGFSFTGRETGLAELVLERPGPDGRYRDGLDVFEGRDLSDAERRFLGDKRQSGAPPRLDGGSGTTSDTGD
jgi:GNAT superfamily N-acetyltransferase